MFSAIFAPAELRDAVSERAWIQAMLEVERALALAEAQAGVIPAEAADAIAAACRADNFDPAALAEAGRAVGNPVEPLVRALTRALGDEAGGFVHWGATSQDMLDTASMLVSRRALDLILAELDGVAACCASLADAHRETLMAARTLLQQAVPTTFGLKAAGWLVASSTARRRLVELRAAALAASWAGRPGRSRRSETDGLEVLRALRRRAEARASRRCPWHTNACPDRRARDRARPSPRERSRRSRSTSRCSPRPRWARSPSRPGARRLVDDAAQAQPSRRGARERLRPAAYSRTPRALGALAQEHERAVGGWHSEWAALSGALELTGGAAARMREVLEGLAVDPDRMRRNLSASGGLLLTERVSILLAGRIGLREAHALVGEVAARAVTTGRPLREELIADSRIGLAPDDVDAVLDPAGYLGSADVFIDRALKLYEGEPATART